MIDCSRGQLSSVDPGRDDIYAFNSSPLPIQSFSESFLRQPLISRGPSPGIPLISLVPGGRSVLRVRVAAYAVHSLVVVLPPCLLSVFRLG